MSAPIDASPAPVFSGMARSTEARELVADAALGLVDSIDLLGPQTSSAGSVALFHRLLNTGIRLAATVGTDTMLSLARCHTYSNPPGWARVYADLSAAPLSVEAWQEAVLHGRTVVTNGPWLTIDVDGDGPGSVADVAPGSRLRVMAACIGEEVTALSIVGPDGPIRSVEVLGPNAAIEHELVVEEPGWVAAIATGPANPHVLGAEVYAHTSPVYIDVDGARVGRAADAEWCLDWLDRLDVLASDHGRFADASQRDDLARIVDEARRYYRSLIA